MKVLDLFSGIGGFSLGLERAGMETVAFCEFDKKAQLVLKKHWPNVPIYNDVRELTYDKLKEDGIVGDSKRQRRQGGELHKGDIPQTLEGGQASSFIPTSEGRKTTKQTNSRKQASTVDLICGGVPCQPFSQAGKRKGDQDDRHLWPEYFRLIQSIRPGWVVCENVTGLINLGLDQVLSDLEGADYSCQTLIIPACALGAFHRRDRLWVVAHSKGLGWPTNTRQYENGDTPKTIIHRRHKLEPLCGGEFPNTTNARTLRVAHGIPNRVDRLKQLGNAVVPQIVEQIGRAIMEIENAGNNKSENS